MKKILCILGILLPIASIAQQRVTINNNGFIVLDNNVFFVVDNGNANAINTAGTGGNLVSEGENDRVRWNIGTSTGTYTLPWTTTPTSQGGNGTKIPFSMQITSAGTGSGRIDFSTYETATDNNTPFPTPVANVATPLDVIDRFWMIDAQGYTTNPASTMTFGYDDAANEMGGTNTITEANLQAQRWSKTVNDWEELVFGTANVGSNTVSGVSVPSTGLFEVWTLVDNINPLPVELSDFTTTCMGKSTLIQWSTVSESNNSHFLLEHSTDGSNFTRIATVDGPGNSSSQQSYSFMIHLNTGQLNYFRLTQVDFDGKTATFDMISSLCEGDNTDVAFFDENRIVLDLHSSQEDDVTIVLFDASGRRILQKQALLNSGQNTLSFDLTQELSTGIYMLSVMGIKKQFTTRIWHK